LPPPAPPSKQPEANAASPATPTLSEQIAALEIECKYRQVKVRQAARMKDVAQLMTVDTRGELASRQSEVRGLKQLQLACENRAKELIGHHLLELRAIRDMDLLVQMRSHFQHREWGFLKGPFPLLFREADSEAERIERNLARALESQNKRQRGRR
jgi:hypothetical protein